MDVKSELLKKIKKEVAEILVEDISNISLDMEIGSNDMPETLVRIKYKTKSV